MRRGGGAGSRAAFRSTDVSYVVARWQGVGVLGRPLFYRKGGVARRRLTGCAADSARGAAWDQGAGIATFNIRRGPLGLSDEVGWSCRGSRNHR